MVIDFSNDPIIAKKLADGTKLTYNELLRALGFDVPKQTETSPKTVEDLEGYENDCED